MCQERIRGLQVLGLKRWLLGFPAPAEHTSCKRRPGWMFPIGHARTDGAAKLGPDNSGTKFSSTLLSYNLLTAIFTVGAY